MPVERVARRLEIDVVGELHRKRAARHRHDAAAGAVDHRDRAAPVALARHAPVAQPVIDLAPAASGVLGAPRDLLLGVGDGHAVDEIRVGEPAVAEIRLLAHREDGGVLVFRHHDGQNGQLVLAGEIEVALVVRRAAEDRAGAVFHQDEVGDIDRQRPVRAERVADPEPGIDAPLLGALDRRLAGAGPAALLDEAGDLRVFPGDLRGQRVLGRDRAEARPEDRVVPRGVDVEPAVAPDHREGEAETLGAADPVLLHRPHLVGPAFEPGERDAQILRVVGDAEEPLRHLALLHGCAGAPAAAVDHLLVGEHRPVDRVPVDPAAGAVEEAAFEEVEEHRLLVAVIARMAGGELAAPVDRKPHRAELAPHRGDILVGPRAGVDALLHGRVLGRHAERVPAHRVQHVEAAGALVARDHVAHRVVPHMPHVDAPRRVGEHLQHVVFRARRIGRDDEGAALVPDRLPMGLVFPGVVSLRRGGVVHGLPGGADSADARIRQPDEARATRSWRARVRIWFSRSVAVLGWTAESAHAPPLSRVWRNTETRSPSARSWRPRM